MSERHEPNNDRRAGYRYPVSAPLEYRLSVAADGIHGGLGKCINMSRGGILFEAERHMEVGMQVELTIDWPGRVPIAAPVRLWILGSVVRIEGKRAAVLQARGEFRTEQSASRS